MAFLNYEQDRQLFLKLNRRLQKRGLHIDPELFQYWEKHEGGKPGATYPVYVGYAVNDRSKPTDLLDIICVALYPFGVWEIANPFDWQERVSYRRLKLI